MNYLMILPAALVPIVIGAVWYNPKVMGTVWMKAAGLSEEKLRSANRLKILGVSLILSLMLAFLMPSIVIHQSHIFSIFADLGNDPDAIADRDAFFEKYGQLYRTFKHGVLHGVIAALFLVLPVFGINALFERKGFRYVAINVGYWIITLGLMGGIVCQLV